MLGWLVQQLSNKLLLYQCQSNGFTLALHELAQRWNRQLKLVLPQPMPHGFCKNLGRGGVRYYNVVNKFISKVRNLL
ncbi:hypothetical protein FACHB389_17770 [Nostoc calcicola FACHB-389]|nr:hypothetical protein FACHB389_17770 [Nostoc calcicola FACHB-389]